MIKTSHETLVARAARMDGGNPRLSMLTHQLRSYASILQDLATKMTAMIGEKQKEANRGFTPAVQEAMERAYELCINESGQYLRALVLCVYYHIELLQVLDNICV
jgi:hypothetical protein